MPKNPLSLSLVIPAYNEESHLKSCLDAIAVQTSTPYEVIVVDNNSKDDTVKVAKSYPFVRVVTACEQGIVHARNVGFDAVRGDVICRIDADSLLEPDWVERAGRYFEKHPKVAAVTGHCYFYDFPFRRFVQVVHHTFYYRIQRLISGTEILWGSNMALRTDAWAAVKDDCLTVSGMHEDIDLSLHLQDKGLRIRRVSKLIAGVSLRRGDLKPKSIVKYLLPWPRTYWLNGRYGQAIAISVVFGGIVLVILPISLLTLVAGLLTV